jgi:dipeptidyl aminopeptidase/acylaminoacyl peptidase
MEHDTDYPRRKDFRVPIGQGQEAFKPHNCVDKSRFYIFQENHWVLKPQNAQVWQKFFKWLKETL